MALTDFLSKEAVAAGWGGDSARGTGAGNDGMAWKRALDDASSQATANSGAGGGLLAQAQNSAGTAPTANTAATDYSTISNAELASTARTNEAQMMAQTDTTNPDMKFKSFLKNVDLSDPNIDMDWVKGVELAAGRKEANTRLGMDQQKMGAALTDRFEARDQMDGLRAATQEGGLAGAIDFMMSVDPEKALKMYQDKTQLDKSIMQNEVMQAALPGDRAKAMVEGYGVLGKMGFALLNAKPEDRAAMYQQVLPMVKQINPNASKTLDKDAIGMFMLAQTQSVPENILYSSKKNDAMYTSDLGKLALARDQAYQKGDVKLATDFQKQYDGLIAVAQKNELQAAKARLDLTRKGSGKPMSDAEVLKANRDEFTSLQKQSKSYNDKMQPLAQIQTLMDQIDANGGIQNKANGLMVSNLKTILGKAAQTGVLTEPDYQRIGGTASWETMAKQLESWKTGSAVPFNQSEYNAAKAMTKGALKFNYDSLKQIHDERQIMSDPYTYVNNQGQEGKLINWNTMAKIYSPYDKFFTPQSTLVNSPKKAPDAAELEVMNNPKLAGAFIQKFGYDPRQ